MADEKRQNLILGRDPGPELPLERVHELTGRLLSDEQAAAVAGLSREVPAQAVELYAKLWLVARVKHGETAAASDWVHGRLVEQLRTELGIEVGGLVVDGLRRFAAATRGQAAKHRRAGFRVIKGGRDGE